MRISPGQVERFLRQPDPRAVLILVYGPDGGLVRERAERLIEATLDDPHDPFRLSELSVDALRSEPGRLADEARSLTLTGGRRVVRVRQATDQISGACRMLLAERAGDALVIVDAGELGSSSSLRRLIEQAQNAAALPCYRDQGRDLAGLIDRLLAEHGLEAEPDARAFLVEHLGADRGVTRNELAKLALCLGDGDPSRPRRISLEQAAAVIGDSSALNLDDLADAAAMGDALRVGRCLDRLLGEGQAPVRIVRTLANHFSRLRRFALAIEQGETAERVLDQARPPVHFRRKEALKVALGRWPPEMAAWAQGRLLEAEIACKQTGWPADLLCRDVALTLARRAAAKPAPQRTRPRA